MNTPITTKFAALAVALMMNGFLIGGIAYLFNGPLHQAASVMSVAHAGASTLPGAV
jgi:hypothetical protein